MNPSHSEAYEAARAESRAIRAALPGPCVAVGHHAVNCATYDPHHVRLSVWCGPCLTAVTSTDEPF